MPVKSGYIGGDLLSFVLTSGVAEQKSEVILGLDLGTNEEIFLGNGKRLLTCSAAAGPALEGARISHGMIAIEQGLLKVLVLKKENCIIGSLVISNLRGFAGADWLT